MTIRMKPFVEEPDLSRPSDPLEKHNVESVRQYAIRNGGKEYHILRGDLHRHTGLSHDGTGDGSLWDYYRYMLDAASMDYTAVTDHQGGEVAYTWWKIQKSNDLFSQPGKLTTLYAYKRSIPYPNGHHNIIFPKRGAAVLDKDPAEVRGEKRSGELLLPYLRKWNAVALPHTSATGQGTDWAEHSNELEPLVEVYQGHRLAYEHEGGPRGATSSRKYLQRSGYEPAGFIWNALAKGYRMGFKASSDHCSTHISYACIIAESNTRAGIIDAIRRRHSFGATDNIVMDFRVAAGGREYLQGDEVHATGPFSLKVEVIGTGPIRRIDVIHNERYVYAVTPEGTSAKFTYQDPAQAPGENRYYVRMEQVDGNLAWSSPVWVMRQ